MTPAGVRGIAVRKLRAGIRPSQRHMRGDQSCFLSIQSRAEHALPLCSPPGLRTKGLTIMDVVVHNRFHDAITDASSHKTCLISFESPHQCAENRRQSHCSHNVPGLGQSCQGPGGPRIHIAGQNNDPRDRNKEHARSHSKPAMGCRHDLPDQTLRGDHVALVLPSM
jgi:hypothetical protein